MADDVERVLVDADHGDLGAWASSFQPLTGQEHGRTIPLADLKRFSFLHIVSHVALKFP
jgi:hypothetical protein